MNSRLSYLAVFLAASCLAAADDAAISFGGSPTILHSHPSIHMRSEKVVITVLKNKTLYDCRFVLRNAGAACTVQVGFPDRGFGASETAFEENKSSGKNIPFSALDDFQSKVDGAAVKTVLRPEGDKPASWHAKLVKFGAGQTHVLEESFSVGNSGGISASGGFLRELRYVLHTGSSWAGTIGKVKIEVNLSNAGITLPAKPLPLSRLGVAEGRSYSGWAKLPAATVAWKGFAAPQRTSTGLRFFTTNLKPTTADDVVLNFGYQRAN